MQTNEAIKLWKELNIDRCEMEFSCGGDSMNDTNFTLYDKEDNEVESEELADYFENQVYKEVEFYEVSDGHYMGEYGKVEITLTMYVELSEKESEVLNKVSNINGSIWDNEPNVNYKEDCVITDEESQTLKELLEKIGNLSDEFEVEGKGEESEESRSFESDIELEEGKLLVQVSARFYYTEESND